MTQLRQFHITLVGCGKMGSALIEGWQQADLLKRVDILDPELTQDVIQKRFTHHENLFHVKLAASLTYADSDLLILAVKPQIMDQICADICDSLPTDLPVLSIAAGKDIRYFQKNLNDSQAVIRTMPNTPAAIGEGITALYATDNVTDAQKEMATALMSAAGKTIWLEDEALMDSVTAVSGSGPAYVFHLIEALASAGTKVGLSEDQAMQLARQTIIGAAALAKEEADTPAATLRQNVTSKGGTTEAALNILMKGDFQDIMDKAVAAATKRGKDLSS